MRMELAKRRKLERISVYCLNQRSDWFERRGLKRRNLCAVSRERKFIVALAGFGQP